MTNERTGGSRVSFYLKRPSDPQTTLFALFFHDGQKTKIYTSISIDPKRWDSKEQKAKTRGYPEGQAINRELERITDLLTALYRTQRAKGIIPSDNDLRAAIAPVQAQDKQFTFWQAWELYTEKKALTKAMTQKLAAIRKRLESFQKKHPLHLDTITHALMEDFHAHLTAEGLQASTAAKHVAFFKSFLHWAVKRELTENIRWQRYCIEAPPDTLKVALSKSELDALRNTPLPKDYLRNCRDLFLIGCLTGLRFSDYSRIQRQHVKDGLLFIRQEKTDSYVEIPLTPEAGRLVNRLISGEIRAISNQKMNIYLKELGRICGLTEPFEVHEFRGKMKVTKTVPKYELLGTHTGRRTFATGLLLAGLPAQTVMIYTGHKDLKSFCKYVNIPKQSQHATVRDALRLMA